MDELCRHACASIDETNRPATLCNRERTAFASPAPHHDSRSRSDTISSHMYLAFTASATALSAASHAAA